MIMTMPPRKMQDLGEKSFIHDHLTLFKQNLPPKVVQGIGDDCSIVERDENTYTIVTVDMTVENTHFLRGISQPEDVGGRVVEVNVSDIVSMGGTPEYCWLSLGMPRDTSVEWVDRFLQGLHEALHKKNTFLLGGDTIETEKEIYVDMTMMGFVPKEQCKRRSDAKRGDIVCVTGFLGNAGCALKIILENAEVDAQRREYLIRHHTHPQAHFRQGMWLGKRREVHAMMDISDGIATDICHIAEMSKVGIELDVDTIPFSDEMQYVCSTMNWDPLPLAATSGDDFSLLFTVDRDHFPQLQIDFRAAFGYAPTPIGRVTEREGEVLFLKRGELVPLTYSGYNHFI